MPDRTNYKIIWSGIHDTNKLAIGYLQRRRGKAAHNIAMSVSSGSKRLIRSYKRVWVELNEELQDLWGFKRDPEMHKFWEIPRCLCPMIDNYERYGQGKGHFVESECPIHGVEQLKWEKEHELEED